MLKKTIAIVDTETSGGNPRYSRIIDIGIVRVEPGKEPRTFSSLVNPEKPVSKGVLELTGIKPEELEKAPVFADLAGTIQEWLKDAVFVAHNAQFDYGFLRHEFARAGKKFSASTVCSVKLSRDLYPGIKGHSLDSIIQRFGLSIENRHRALDDAKAVWDFFCCAHREGRQFALCFEKASDARIESFIPREKLEEIEENPGAFLFTGKNGAPLYAGFSYDVRGAVFSHLDPRKRTRKYENIRAEAYDVKILYAAGDFSARMTAYQWIEIYKPRYNNQSREYREKRKWPVRGVLAIEEHDPLAQIAECWFIDKWKVMAKVRTEGEAGENFSANISHPHIKRLVLSAVEGRFPLAKIRTLKRAEAKRMLESGNDVPEIQID